MQKVSLRQQKGSKRSAKASQEGQTSSKWSPRAPKGCQMEAKRVPKRCQNEPPEGTPRVIFCIEKCVCSYLVLFVQKCYKIVESLQLCRSFRICTSSTHFCRCSKSFSRHQYLQSPEYICHCFVSTNVKQNSVSVNTRNSANISTQ